MSPITSCRWLLRTCELGAARITQNCVTLRNDLHDVQAISSWSEAHVADLVDGLWWTMCKPQLKAIFDAVDDQSKMMPQIWA